MIRISADAVELEYTWDGTSIVGPPPLATQLQLSLWREGQAPWQVQPDPDETWLGVEPVNGVAAHQLQYR